jgi:hypothetical protein
MNDDEERKEQERLKNEAEDERKKMLQRFGGAVLVFWDHVGFDMNDSQLICKTLPQTLTWTKPEHKEIHVVELYWRTKDGNYFKLSYDEENAMPFPVDISDAHRMLREDKRCQWFLTDIQRHELIKEDFDLAAVRGSRIPTRHNKDV